MEWELVVQLDSPLSGHHRAKYIDEDLKTLGEEIETDV